MSQESSTMKSTSIRLPPRLHRGISSTNESIGDIVRPALRDYLIDRLVGRCVVTGEPLYTHSDYMCVGGGTPVSSAIGIDGEVEQFVISNDEGVDAAKAVSTKGQADVYVTPEYYNDIGPVLYAAEEEYLSHIRSSESRMGWAEALFDPSAPREYFPRWRATSLLIWCDQEGIDRDGVTVQTIWDSLSDDTQDQVLQDKDRDVDENHLAEALEEVDI